MDDSLCATRTPPLPRAQTFGEMVGEMLDQVWYVSLHAAVKPRYIVPLVLTLLFYVLSLFPIFVLGGSTIRASKRLSHACGVGPGPCFALLGQGHALVSTQIRPPSLKTTASPMPPPSVRRLLVSLNFHKIAPIGAAAELQGIGGQRGEAAVGCYPPGLSAIFWYACFLPSRRLSRSYFFFDVSPSRRHNAASSQRLRAHSLSPRRPRCCPSQRYHLPQGPSASERAGWDGLRSRRVRARGYFGMLELDGVVRGPDLAWSAEGWTVLGEEKS
ncbi:hypothetical protein B0H13DRAFT_2520818 [Mycena leptocephala]|nr:hypothetical protein B0H13DRAFT_2520818 [Mycena leptocephala]